MRYVDLDGVEPSEYGVEIRMYGAVQLESAVEGDGYMVQSYNYPTMVEPIALYINDIKVPLPKELTEQLERTLISYLD